MVATLDLLGGAERRAANLALILAEYLKQVFDSADSSLKQLAIHSRRIGADAVRGMGGHAGLGARGPHRRGSLSVTHALA